MYGGNIVIRGNVGDDIGHKAGWRLNGGIITIYGDAGYGVGYNMKCGEIHLEGGYKGISEEVCGGRIYHRGKLIFDK
jgi:formylmethanofuran dehydrogenase subunit C